MHLYCSSLELNKEFNYSTFTCEIITGGEGEEEGDGEEERRKVERREERRREVPCVEWRWRGRERRGKWR